MNLFQTERRSAVFSDDRVYRYTLDIVWDEDRPLCQFIGLNPSTADEIMDDPTVRRCKGFARREGCGGIVMTNIFAFRSTDPQPMKKHPAPIGEITGCGIPDPMMEFNDWHILKTADRCRVVIAAWGAHGSHLNRGKHVADLLYSRTALKCLGKTGAGHPKHPLYLAANTPLIPFSYEPIKQQQEK